MIRITVEMVPHGDESKKTLFAVAEIALQKHSPDGQLGTYHTRTSHTAKYYKPGKWWKQGVLENFQRLKKSPWELITMALATCWLTED